MSSDVHLLKPDIRIYQYLLEKYKLMPEECFFIDDRTDNVRGAEKAGMKAALFRGDFEEMKRLIA